MFGVKEVPYGARLIVLRTCGSSLAYFAKIAALSSGWPFAQRAVVVDRRNEAACRFAIALQPVRAAEPSADHEVRSEDAVHRRQQDADTPGFLRRAERRLDDGRGVDRAAAQRRPISANGISTNLACVESPPVVSIQALIATTLMSTSDDVAIVFPAKSFPVWMGESGATQSDAFAIVDQPTGADVDERDSVLRRPRSAAADW